MEAAGLYYVWTSLAQAGWTLTFANEAIVPSLFFMVVILYSLAKIVVNLREYNTEYFLWKFPFTVHLGWIAAATALNANLVVVWVNASAASQYYTGAGSIVFLLMLALYLNHKSEPAFTIPLVVVWALMGIYSELSSPDESITERFTTKQLSSIRILSIAGSTLLVARLIVKGALVFKERRSLSMSEEAVYLRIDE